MTDAQASLSVCDIRSLSQEHATTLATLQVSDQKEIFGGSFTESLDAWAAGPPVSVLGLCFLHEGQPIGLTLFKRPPLSPAWVPPNTASIHGLKIAVPWQGRGFGHHAFGLSVQTLKATWPDITTLMLAVDAPNTTALSVYRGFGMSDSGPVFQGKYGMEHRLEISLTQT